jgi:presenilin-like A22 family membrane protease
LTEQEKQEPQKQSETENPKKELDRFKFEFVYLAPILASLFFGLACAYLLAPHQTEFVPPSTPFNPDSPGAPVANALYFVVLVAISATVFYFLLKRRSKRIIKALIVSAMTAASLLLSYVYLLAIFANFPDWNILVIPLSIIIAVFFDLSIFRFGGTARNAAVICVGGALGVFFGSSILQFGGLFSVVLILSFLAIYDIIAVYKGPIGKIAQAQSGGGLDELQGLSFSFKDIQMGLGDLVFYSMLTGAVFFNFIYAYAFPLGFLPCVVAILGILLGSVVTFYMLEHRGIFPGLPFPILLGLAGGLITGFLIVPLL